MSELRIIRDESPALSDDELHARGNELVTEARTAAIDAVRQSMISEFLARGLSLQKSDLRRWRERAKTAREAWAKVEALTDELIREIEKNQDAALVGKRMTVVPDGSGRPGHYMTAWVDDPDQEGQVDR
ncbi:MAG: hypothetical protein P0Y60_14560 [Candidatus Microbacterium colombiense]|nr:MAG: hypothetical protein P0Y60_14560 [Microbacterium sp.]